MSPIRATELPEDALLGRYRREGAYTDCYVTEIPHRVTQDAYILAFYTSWLFKLERLLLSWLLLPSTDAEARELALGRRTAFAAWDVEKRAPNQLLMCDFQGRTRSWLMCSPIPQAQGTRLLFGSAVVAVVDERSGERRLGLVFHLLLGFHKRYARALLRAAAARLSQQAREG